MNISPDEAEEELAAIRAMVGRTRASIAGSGTSINLIVTGIVWLVGYTATQFLAQPAVIAVWIVAAVLGSIVASILGARVAKRVRTPLAGVRARQIALLWAVLVVYCAAAIAITWPLEGRQMTTLIILFVMVGQLAMGLLLSFATVWWTLPVSALVLAVHFLLPDLYYLGMGILVGGAMIVLGLYIRSRW
ncbi:MAG: hypothetical protein MUF84_19045 [Anaerolineae bacterium]|nr:hypothetical protein [Anaerolineae bacterium]